MALKAARRLTEIHLGLPPRTKAWKVGSKHDFHWRALMRWATMHDQRAREFFPRTPPPANLGGFVKTLPCPRLLSLNRRRLLIRSISFASTPSALCRWTQFNRRT